MEIGDRLRQLMERHNFSSRRALGRELGIADTTLIRVEKNAGSVALWIIKKIAEYFNVSLDWLIYGKEPEPPEYEEIRNVIERAFERARQSSAIDHDEIEWSTRKKTDFIGPNITRGFREFMHEIAEKRREPITNDEYRRLATFRITSDRELTADDYGKLLELLRDESGRNRLSSKYRRDGPEHRAERSNRQFAGDNSFSIEPE